MTILGLEPLPSEAAGQLLDELLAADLPAEIRDVVVSRAEGNPFFVEELVGSLIDGGVLQRENGGWRASDLPPGYAVPDSIQGVLAARIDLLSETQKAALQAAAVIGRVFWPGPVRALTGGGEPDFPSLEERDFIRRRTASSLEGEREFAFKHALTREVAYSSLPKGRRAHLHAEFAGWLERVGEARDQWAALLAHHYAEAARPEDADLAWTGAEDELQEVGHGRSGGSDAPRSSPSSATRWTSPSSSSRERSCWRRKRTRLGSGSRSGTLTPSSTTERGF